MTLPPSQEAETSGLVRTLGLWDVTTITAGTMLGSAIFLAAAIVAREVPHPALVMVLWVAGGFVAVAGALTYAELGTMFPRAGGQYEYLKEAFGPLWGFLFGWTSLIAIQSGGVAYVATAFGEYLGSFIPFFSASHVLGTVSLGAFTWQLNSTQVAAIGAVIVLSAINYFGTSSGALVQGLLTAVKLLAVGGLIGFGLLAPARAHPAWTGPLPSGNLAAAMGLALVAILGNFDGWYQATFSAGEVRRPERNLPLGMIAGTVLIGLVYLLIYLVYFRALPIDAVGASSKLGEEATAALLGPTAGRLLAATVLIATFGCVSSTILSASRLGVPMAADVPAFEPLARVHPRYRTPTIGIVVLGLWSSLLILSGSYEQLFEYSVFTSLIFHGATGLAIFALRRRRPAAPRPYRTFGYPFVPALFVLAMAGMVLDNVWEHPAQSLLGVGLSALGIPLFYWRRRAGRGTA